MFNSVALQIFDYGGGQSHLGRPEFSTWLLRTRDVSNTIPKQFVGNERWPRHKEPYENLSFCVQEALVFLMGRTRQLTTSRNLCYAGGVALNGVANEKVVYRGDFEHFYVSRREDSCGAWGCLSRFWLTERTTRPRLEVDAMGRRYTNSEILTAVESTPAVEVIQTLDAVVDALDRCGGWMVSVLLPNVGRFQIEAPQIESPFMLRVCPFRDGAEPQVPAVSHVDHSGRVQTVSRVTNRVFYDLVSRFGERTGVPMLLNTSFNVMGEPIVESPEDALWCLLYTGVDLCVLGDTLVRKCAGYHSVLDLTPAVLPVELRTKVLGWGEVATGLTSDSVTVLGAVETTGWGLLSTLGQSHQMTEIQIVTALGQLRRASCISFAWLVGDD